MDIKKKKKLFVIIGSGVIVVALAVVLCLNFFRKPIDNRRKNELTKQELAKEKEKVTINLHRYEIDLFALNRDSLAKGIERLSHIYPEQLIAKGVWNDPQMVRQLRGYLDDKVINEIQRATVKKYPNLDFLKEELSEAFAYYHHYFPGAVIPTIITMVPGLDYSMPSVFGFDANLFIQLDQYIGADFKMYGETGLPKYISARCESKYIAIDCFKKSLIYNYLPEQVRISLLDNMIYEGKKIYFAELHFPERPLEDIIGYSPDKFVWAQEYQGQVWKYMIDKDQLFSKEESVSRNYCEESPYTKPFTNVSPGRMGTFIGWQIIRKYMENNQDISLEEMLKNKDAQTILNGSKYKPK